MGYKWGPGGLVTRNPISEVCVSPSGAWTPTWKFTAHHLCFSLNRIPGWMSLLVFRPVILGGRGGGAGGHVPRDY